jgi:hypothetical protein
MDQNTVIALVTSGVAFGAALAAFVIKARRIAQHGHAEQEPATKPLPGNLQHL